MTFSRVTLEDSATTLEFLGVGKLTFSEVTLEKSLAPSGPRSTKAELGGKHPVTTQFCQHIPELRWKNGKILWTFSEVALEKPTIPELRWKSHRMNFVLSATVNASDLRQVLQLWNECGDPRNPFAHVLISPLFAAQGTFQLVRDELKARRGSIVYFDSGGYYVQQGRMPYETLYSRLLDCYRANTWADWYVLPDHVPTSRDAPEVVESKVHDTITAAGLFYDEMPATLQPRALPVVQGHTEKQVTDCVETYAQLGAKYIGFGSFGTSGASSQMNTVTDQSIRMLRLLNALGQEFGFRLHLFGVSTPPILYIFDRLGVYSFDSLAWMKAAGYGNVFLPLVRGYMVTYRIYDRTHTYQESFDYLKELTGHTCVFCDDFSMLVSNRMYRILHNLCSVLDTLDILATGRNGKGKSTRQFSQEAILKIIREGSPTYLRYYEAI